MAFKQQKELIETMDPLEVHVMAKRIKIFIDELIVCNKSDAEDQLITGQLHYYNAKVSKTNGATILDYEADETYKSLKEMLNERKTLLDAAFKMKDEIFDGDGVLVPKVPIKGYRPDNLMITL